MRYFQVEVACHFQLNSPKTAINKKIIYLLQSISMIQLSPMVTLADTVLSSPKIGLINEMLDRPMLFL